jgi:hypothetical protein
MQQLFKESNMMFRSSILLLSFFLAATPAIRADEPKKMPAAPEIDPFGNYNSAPSVEKKPAEPVAEPKKKWTEQEIKELIDNLVSPNPKPITEDDDYRLSPSFDRDKQKLVRKAFSELKSVGPQAFPFLIDRWDDERYCLTTSYGTNGYCHNENVGTVCKMIFFDQIQTYGSWSGFADSFNDKLAWRPDYPAHFLSTKTDAKKWCEEHKDKTLAEIQLEVLDFG